MPINWFDQICSVNNPLYNKCFKTQPVITVAEKDILNCVFT